MAGRESDNGDRVALVVEDSLTQAEALRHSLESRGYECLAARNGREALEILRARRPALIVSDVIMPEMDGFEFCRRVKSDEELKNIPVILLTSLADSSDVIRGLECGADNFVTKPYEEEYLLDRISQLLDRRHPHQEDQRGIEVEFGGQRRLITAERRQILDLLLSTYDQAVQINRRLERRERELEASNARLSTLHAIGVTTGESLDIAQILNDVAARIVEIPGASAAAIFLLEEGRLALKASRDFPPQLAELIADRRIEPDGTTAVDDLGGLHRFNDRPLAFAPLRAKGTVNGLLVIASSSTADLLRDGSELMQGVANQLAVAIENSRLYEAAQRARAAAEEANRAKDAFLAMVTHELRSPLNAVFGWTRVLLTKQVDEEVRRHALEAIEQSARAQSHIVEDLLDTARISSGKMRLDPRPVDLNDAINSALDVVRLSAEAKEIELKVKSDAGRHLITGDPDRLQQIIWNLLSNAIKFTPEGGRVVIELERADPHLRLTVSDTGRGIKREFLPYVFDRFSQQADQTSSGRRRSGLGLGLSLAKRLVELHGGTIVAESPGEGQGATFTVNLPIRAVRPKAPRPPASPNQDDGEPRELVEDPAIFAGLRMLVVDNEEDARDLVTVVLKQFGAEVTPVASAADALAALTSGERYDALISDIEMPGQSGYDLMRKVRALAPDQGRNIPAIALTAYGRSSDRIRSLAAGFQSHVPKPVDPTELAAVIARLLDRYHEPRQP